jgi:hypothetical protein
VLVCWSAYLRVPTSFMIAIRHTSSDGNPGFSSQGGYLTRQRGSYSWVSWPTSIRNLRFPIAEKDAGVTSGIHRSDLNT